MDRGHEALLDPEVVVDDLGQRRQAVGRARGVRHDRHVAAQARAVDADDEHGGVRRRRRDHHALCAALQVLGRALDRGEDPRGLDDELGAEVAPRDRRRVPLGRHRDLGAVDDKAGGRGVVADLVAGEHGMHRVVLEHVGGVVRGDEGVVDGDDLRSRFFFPPEVEVNGNFKRRQAVGLCFFPLSIRP